VGLRPLEEFSWETHPHPTLNTTRVGIADDVSAANLPRKTAGKTATYERKALNTLGEKSRPRPNDGAATHSGERLWMPP